MDDYEIDGITIGICADKYVETKHYEYMLSMINAQTFKNYKIIISLDKYDAMNIVEIIDLINMIGFDHRIVRIRFNKSRVGIEENINWITSNCDSDYCVILKNEDAFIDIYSLKNICDDIMAYRKNNLLIMVNEQGGYIKKTCEKLVYVKRKRFSINIMRRLKKRKAVLRRIDYPENGNKIFDDYCYDLNNNSELNHNDAFLLEQVKNNPKWAKDELISICNNASHSKWGITDSQKYLMIMLKKAVEGNVDDSYKTRISKRIKLLFLTMEFSVFPSIQKLVDYAIDDDRFDVDLVYVPFVHPNKARPDVVEIEAYKKRGYRIILDSDYDLPQRSPDIAFIIKPYDSVPREYYISEIYRVVDKVVFIKYCPDAIDYKNSDYYDKSFYRSSLNYVAWKNFCSSKRIYENRKDKAWVSGDDNWVLEETIRGDMDIDTVKRNYPIETDMIRERAKNRRVLFWNSHHFISGKGSVGTFLHMGEDMIGHMKRKNHLFFVWRPHPLFWNALINERGRDYVNRLKEDIDNCENIMIDESDSYLPAFYLSDGLISDMSSLVGEYLCTEKPICFLYSEFGNSIYPREYLDTLYVSKTQESFDMFLSMILEGRDEKKALRIDAVYSSFIRKDQHSTTSERILDFIDRELS